MILYHFILLYTARLQADPEIFARTVYEARVGTNVTIDCPFRPGALPQFYSITWFRFHNDPTGSLTIINSPPAPGSGYRILSNFSLVINASLVQFSTTRDRYVCQVIVNNPNPGNRILYADDSDRIQVKTFGKHIDM